MSTQQALGRWLSVKPCNYVASDDPVDIRILTSPYDIPDWVRSGYDDDLGRFVVEFRYMLDEDYRIFDVGDGVRVRLGKHSNRIVGVEVDVDQPGAYQVPVPAGDPRAGAYEAIKKAIQNVEETINARARRSRRARLRRQRRGEGDKRQNYVVAQRVLEDKQAEIFGNVQDTVAGSVADR